VDRLLQNLYFGVKTKKTIRLDLSVSVAERNKHLSLRLGGLSEQGERA